MAASWALVAMAVLLVPLAIHRTGGYPVTPVGERESRHTI